MDKFLKNNRPNLGLVSLEAPLISNLSVSSNLALIRQYHDNLPWVAANMQVLALLNRFGIASTAEKRNPALTFEERFCILLVRAALVKDAIVVMDRPFRIVPDLQDGRFFSRCIKKVDDLIAEAHIFDYNWEKERYGAMDGAEN